MSRIENGSLYEICRPLCMRTTLNIDSQILEKAAKLTGVREKTLLLHEDLKALIARESLVRLHLMSVAAPQLQS